MQDGTQNNTQDKLERLKALLRSYGRLAVAFSGGVDSTFLLDVAHEVLEDDVAAALARSCLMPEGELEQAETFCKERGINLLVLDFDPLSLHDVRSNPADRCYHCKRALVAGLSELAAPLGFDKLADGSNTDDESDYRPGSRALAEAGVLSPLAECGLSKSQIRRLSRKRGLSTWNKTSAACLASRIAYGQEIDPATLARVDAAEQALLDMGFSCVRVRVSGRLARVELAQDEIEKAAHEGARIADALHSIGFETVSLDLDGYHPNLP